MGDIMSTINSNGTMVFGNTLGGSVTIAPKNDTATNYTLSIPDVTAQVAVGQANDPAVKIAVNAAGSAPIYACRAWVNFNGTGTVAIRASGNVSSITDNGVGTYTVNFMTAMPDANYCPVSNSSTNSGVADYIGGISQLTTTSCYMNVRSGTNANVDKDVCTVSIFR